MQLFSRHFRASSRWLVVGVLTACLLWLPFHLVTEPHCDSGAGHAHAQALTEHPHPVDADGHHSHDDADRHHYTTDHESKFLSKRQALLFAPTLVTWQQTLSTPVFSVTIELPVSAAPAPPPADFSPPSGPRAPPLA